MKVNELDKITYLLRRDMDSGNKSFVYNADVETVYEKYYRYVTADQRLLSFALDYACMVSDCYIMYAIAHMGVADKKSILLFLETIASKYPKLNIKYRGEKGEFEQRLRALCRYGFLFRFLYTVDGKKENGEFGENAICLYTLVESGYEVVNQRLQKRVAKNGAIQFKPMSELIGWASAAYVGACIARSSGKHFVDFLDRVLRTKQLGAVYLPVELKTNVDGAVYYIAVVSSYLQHNEISQTEEDYAEYCAFKINTIKNYLYCRTTKGTSIVVVTVENNADLMDISSLIYSTGILTPYLDRVYFTGEGILKQRGDDASKAFLRMYLDEKEEIGYGFEYAVPVFI